MDCWLNYKWLTAWLVTLKTCARRFLAWVFNILRLSLPLRAGRSVWTQLCLISWERVCREVLRTKPLAWAHPSWACPKIPRASRNTSRYSAIASAREAACLFPLKRTLQHLLWCQVRTAGLKKSSGLNHCCTHTQGVQQGPVFVSLGFRCPWLQECPVLKFKSFQRMVSKPTFHWSVCLLSGYVLLHTLKAPGPQQGPSGQRLLRIIKLQQ